MVYLKNGWYVAAWSYELTPGKLLARTLLEDPIVLFRDSNGRPIALYDRCPHRFAPLSLGRVKGDIVECGYHGLCYDRSGACVQNPQASDRIPKGAVVRSYPLVERQTILWIWMGDPAQADEGLIPDYPSLGDRAHWRPVQGHSMIPGNYVLGIDNLMDLSHPEFLHDSSLGSPALKQAHYEVKEGGPRTVHSNRWFDEGPLPPLMEASFPTGGRPVEHWINMRWEAPANLWLDVGATFTGRPRPEGMQSFAAHLLTPETPTSTHYFWASLRNHHLDSEEIDERTRAALRKVFEDEDARMVGAVQQRMSDREFWSLKPVMLPGDAGAVRVRRVLEKLIAAETTESFAPQNDFLGTSR